MAYCPECGSEIVEVEGFCPYCGISLQPVAVKQDEETKSEGEFIHEIVEDSTEFSNADLENSPETDPAVQTENHEAEENSDLSMSETIMVDRAQAESLYTSEASEQKENQSQTEGKIETAEDVSFDDFEKTAGESDKTSEFEQNTGINPETDFDHLENSSEVSENPTADAESVDFAQQANSAKPIEPAENSESGSLDGFGENEDSGKMRSDAQESDPEPEPEDVNFDLPKGASVEAEQRDSEDLLEIADDTSTESAESFQSEDSDLLSGEDLSFPDQSGTKPAAFEQARENSVENGFGEDDFSAQEKNSADEKSSDEEKDFDENEGFDEIKDFDNEAQTIIKGSHELNLPFTGKSEEESDKTPSDSPETDREPSEFSESSGAGESEEPASSTTPIVNPADTGGKSSKLKPLEEGTVLNDRYEIVRKIGGGGMGAVYLASDKNLGGVLRAVKEMVQSYIEEEQQEKAIRDFKRESMLLTSLEHSSIPTIYDYFFDQKEARFYLVMKYISGGDLAARLKAAPEGRLDEKSVVEWGIQIADVLSYLHNRQPPIVYRDLKPANVMIDGNTERVMLIDFGIARWINKEEKGVTAVGTMGYAPPELFSGNVEPRSDVYSLGSTMFHLLTGADPQSNPLLIFDFQKHPRPRQINPNLSDQIERILLRAVEYNADKRFESAAQMRDALVEHLEKLKAGQVSYGIKQSPKSVGLENQPVFCGFCGQKIVASDMFCAFCGAKQPLAQPGVHSQDYIQIKQTARLIIDATGELDAPTFLLEKTENLVGRRDPLSNIFPEVDLSKYDPQTKISRKHARIWREGDNFLVEDLGSSNGTLLISSMNNPVRLEPNKARILSDGDKIKLGDTTLQFIVQ